ncbi:MAG TPA: hypothetical protein ENK18_03895 [Deltaproteobacteria bacterium]|nr:hypothetical protein [Deltaproteobacteria bacterium]
MVEAEEAPTEVSPIAAPTDPPRPGALQRLRRLGARLLRLAVVGLLALIALLLGWLQSGDFQHRVTGLSDRLLQDALGEQVSIERINVRYWPPGLTAVGVHVVHAPTQETILSAERVRIPLKLRLTGGPTIGRLQLQQPRVHLHLEPDGGIRELRDMIRPPPELRRPMTRLPFSELQIEGGQLRLDLPADQGTIQLAHLEVEPRRGSTADLSGDLSVRYRGLEEATHLDWSGITLGPETIRIPKLILDTRLANLEGRLEHTLGGAIEADLSAKVQLEQLDGLLEEPRALYGKVDLDLMLEGTLADPTLHVVALTTALGLDVPGVLTPKLSYEIGDATASAIARRDGVQIEQVVLDWGGGSLVGWGFVSPSLQLLDGHAIGSNVALAPMLQAFDVAPTPWVDMRADAEVSIEGALAPLDLSGTFDFAVADLHVGDRPIADPAVELMLDLPHAHASGTLHVDRQALSMDAPVVRGPRNQGSMTMEIGLVEPRGPLDLRFDMWSADLSDFGPLGQVELRGTGAVSGRIWGYFNQLQLAGEGQLDGFSVLGIPYADHLSAKIRSPDMRSVHLDEATAVLGSSRYGGSYSIDFAPPISMDTDITIERGRIEDLVGMFIDLEGLTGELSGTLSLHGPLFELDGGADLRLAEVDLFGEHFPTGRGLGFMDAGRFTLDDLRVRRGRGRAGITLRGSVDRAWALDMELVADGLRLEHLDRLDGHDVPLSGKISVISRITDTLFDPSPDGRIQLTGVRYAGEPVADSILRFDSEDGITTFTGDLIGGSARVAGTLGLWGEQPYALIAELSELPAHLLYPEAADGSPLRATVSGTVEIGGDFGEVWSPVTIDAKLPRIRLSYQHHVLTNQGPWIYHQDGTAFDLSGFNLHSGTTHFEMAASSDTSLLLAGEGRIDLDLLRAMVPGLDRASGQAEVELSAVGSRPNVEAMVDVRISADLLRHDSAPLTFEDASAWLQIRKDRIDLLAMDAKVGGGVARGAGRIDAVDWVPSRYDLQVQVDDAQVQWVESLPPAIGDGTFSFDGPTDALLLSGDVQINEMTFADRIDWEDWVVEYRETMLVDPATIYDDEPMFNLNVSIGADRTIRLQNNVAEGIASADLRIIGDTVRPGLVGTVTVNEGLAFLQDREFRIDRGNLLFNDPWSWDPQLDFSLLTDIDSREQRYRVDYQVFGPFSDWRTTTRSDPPLPQSDVNALLWFGVTLDELEEMGELSTAVVQGVADLLVTDFFVSGQAGDLRDDLPDFLQFDRIDLATGVNVRGDYSPDPRLVVDKRLHDLADVDLTWELNLMRPDEAYVSAQKRIGGMWSLSGWYATLQRDRVLPIGGAYGVDVTARWEIE